MVESKRQLNKAVMPFVLAALVAAGLACGFFHRGDLKTSYLILEVDSGSEDNPKTVEQIVGIIHARIASVELNDFRVLPDPSLPNRRILIQLPAAADLDRIKRLVLAQGMLEIREVISDPSPSPAQKYPSRESAVASAGIGEVFPYAERSGADQKSEQPLQYVVLQREVIVSGREIKDASAVSPEEGQYQIHFRLNAAGATRFAEWTGNHINSYIAIVLNDTVRSIAYIKSQISDSGQIDGKFSKEQADEVALVFRSGGYPVPVKLIKEGKYDSPIK